MRSYAILFGTLLGGAMTYFNIDFANYSIENPIVAGIGFAFFSAGLTIEITDLVIDRRLQARVKKRDSFALELEALTAERDALITKKEYLEGKVLNDTPPTYLH